MQAQMIRLDRFLRRNHRAVLGLWALLVIAAVPFAARQTDRLSAGGFAVNGSESADVADILDRDFARLPRAQLGVLLVRAPGTARARLRTTLARVEQVASRASHVELEPRALHRARVDVERGGPVLVPLTLDVSEDEAVDVAAGLRGQLDDAAGRGGVTVYLVGEGAVWDALREVAKEDLAAAEERGFPIVLLILIVAFGSLGAAALPLAIGFFSVLLTGAAIFFLSRSIDMSVYVTNMASMIGIGVAVDYSLFVLARYREEIAEGRYRALARSRALATSGLAVTFSGLTVIAALAGLWLIDNQAIRSMAIGAVLVVALSVIAAVTLLPVLIQRLGYSAFVRMRIHTVTGVVFRALRSRLRRRPGFTLLLAGGLLLTLALPALSLQMGERSLDQLPRDNETRVGVERAAAAAGPGALAPVRVVVTPNAGPARSPANRTLVADLRAQIAAEPGIARVDPPMPADDARAVLISATLRTDGESDPAKAVIERLRAALPPIGADRAAVDIGGVTASVVDTQDQIAGSMWKIIVWVLVLAFVVLVVLLRSIVLAAKAVVMNLLSVGAAYGVLVVVFQWGWLDGLLGFDALGRIGVLTPPLVLAVVFGLSMDYEIFLLTRIRERYEATGDTRLAVAQGLATSGRTITSAALIMVSVFGVFVFTGVPTIRELGLGNAVAIAIDATVVRLTIVPATMVLLGRWNWWLPAPLARLLPASFERGPEPPRTAPT